MSFPAVSVPGGPVPQISKHRVEASENLEHHSDAHAAARWSATQRQPHVLELGGQAVDRVSGEVADGVDEGGVVPQLTLPEFFQLQVVENSGVLVNESQLGVDATEDDVIRKTL